MQALAEAHCFVEDHSLQGGEPEDPNQPGGSRNSARQTDQTAKCANDGTTGEGGQVTTAGCNPAR